jgi:hypothetical protein
MGGDIACHHPFLKPVESIFKRITYAQPANQINKLTAGLDVSNNRGAYQSSRS